MAVDGHLIADDEASAAEWPRWRRYLSIDALVGILGDLATTLMTCLLAYALLYPARALARRSTKSPSCRARSSR